LSCPAESGASSTPRPFHFTTLALEYWIARFSRATTNAVDREGMALASRGDRLAQGSDMIDEQRLPALQQVNRAG
jgi:hypothetical protein